MYKSIVKDYVGDNNNIKAGELKCMESVFVIEMEVNDENDRKMVVITTRAAKVLLKNVFCPLFFFFHQRDVQIRAEFE